MAGGPQFGRQVVEAQLEAFRERDLAEVFRLYSRARRMLLKEGLSHKDKTPGMRTAIASFSSESYTCCIFKSFGHPQISSVKDERFASKCDALV